MREIKQTWFRSNLSGRTLCKNREVLSPGMIPLTKNKVATVDLDIWELANKINWHSIPGQNTFYAAKRLKVDGRSRTILMHHFVLGYPLNNNQVDHIDGNGLNNKRSNLRIVSQRGNLQNQECHRNGTKASKYIGVTKSGNCWLSRIYANGKRLNLGHYKTEVEAGEAYKKALLDIGNV